MFPQIRALHPVFGPGEDRNRKESVILDTLIFELHPVFGPGEDRNGGGLSLLNSPPDAAPGPRTG